MKKILSALSLSAFLISPSFASYSPLGFSHEQVRAVMDALVKQENMFFNISSITILDSRTVEVNLIDSDTDEVPVHVIKRFTTSEQNCGLSACAFQAVEISSAVVQP